MRTPSRPCTCSPELKSPKYLSTHRVAAMLEFGELAEDFVARSADDLMRGLDGQLWLEDDCTFSLREVVREGFCLPISPGGRAHVRATP